MRKKYRAGLASHTTVPGNTDRKSVWGMWWTAPHVGLHLQDLYPSKGEAESAAREMIGKKWADHTVVRKVTLGPCATLEAKADG